MKKTTLSSRGFHTASLHILVRVTRNWPNSNMAGVLEMKRFLLTFPADTPARGENESDLQPKRQDEDVS